ncbi:MAG TPA: PLDc N-terminal domain-containing protein [Granulicella sp.]
MRLCALKRSAIVAALCLLPSFAFAQRGYNDAATEAAGFACCGSLFLIPVVLFILNIAMLVWVARDAKARGLDNSVLWMLLVFFTSIIGLIIYILSRPQGNLVTCPNCRNKKLQAALRCPYCGYATQ